MPQKKITVQGKGTDMTNKKALKGRSKRKLIGQRTSLHLIDVANKKGDKESAKAYWGMFHCQSKLTSANGRLYGKYCRNRACPICNSIRKATIMKAYLPIIEAWSDAHFTTLTIRSVPAYRLKQMIGKVNEGFRRIKDKYRKRAQTGKGQAFVGIKSLECNFNPKKKTYNPHLHLIFPTKEMAETFTKEWLELWTEKWSLPCAQKTIKIGNSEKVLIEVVKYSSKIFTEPDGKKHKKPTGNAKVYIAALNNILQAMKGHRVFDRFGFNLPEYERPKALLTELDECQEWKYKAADWKDEKTGQVLTDFEPEAGLNELLKGKMDTEIE